jgi:hypothetical protein
MVPTIYAFYIGLSIDDMPSRHQLLSSIGSGNRLNMYLNSKIYGLILTDKNSTKEGIEKIVRCSAEISINIRTKGVH